MGKKNTKEALADETEQLVHQIIEQGVDCVIGGSPCQDNSFANQSGQGVDGERSGLVWQMVRTLRLVRPKLWLLENVPAMLARGFHRVVGRLACCGYDTEWDCLSAHSHGAPHYRARIYAFAYPSGTRRQGFFKETPQKQPEFNSWGNFRCVEDIPTMSPLYPSQLCRGNNGVAKRLHGIGNGNPPCIIRELMRNL
jgi:DNA (cytosine-5)-methyltransferase 1